MIRTAEHPIHKMFLDRWSPRAMSGQSITEEQLMSLFEAARWAPSSYNNQSWRFVYALRDTPTWKNIFDVIVPANQIWAKNAAALVVIISKTTFNFNNKPTRTHSFDTGAAWMSFALQGSLMGLVVHGMEGFDYKKAHTEIHVPVDYQIEAMCAVGFPGKKELLPPELQKVEEPSGRKSLRELVFEGIMK